MRQLSFDRQTDLFQNSREIQSAAAYRLSSRQHLISAFGGWRNDEHKLLLLRAGAVALTLTMLCVCVCVLSKPQVLVCGQTEAFLNLKHFSTCSHHTLLDRIVAHNTTQHTNASFSLVRFVRLSASLSVPSHARERGTDFR